MKYVVTIVSLIVFSCFGIAQNISLSPQSLTFDTLLVNTRDSLSFRVRNTGDDTLRVTDINTNKAAFSVRDTAFVVAPHDSVRVWLYFETNQNVTWRDVVLIEHSAGHGALPLRVTATAKFSGSAYATTQGLWENDLKTALFNLVNNHTVLGYNVGRDRMFETIDDPQNIDTIECVYIGRRIRAVTRTEAQNQNFNTEHTWPQSFFGSADPMVSDVNHLFPTDADPNSRRANYPFGPVANITWQNGGSKLGTRSTGELVFEPRDVHKGDVARVLFYFLLRYPSNYGGYMTANQENDLRVWYKTDPVSQKEILRTGAIATYQGKRNPLVDHPEFIDRISIFRSASPAAQPDLLVSPAAVQFPAISPADSTEWRLTLVNKGRGGLSISSVTLQNASSVFHILDAPSTIPADSFVQVRVAFKPDAPNQSFANSVRILSNDPLRPTVTVGISGNSSGATSVVAEDRPLQILLNQNYPNPFNPATTISFVLNQTSPTTLQVFDVLGRNVATLVDGSLSAGRHEIVWNAESVSSGVYVYRLNIGGSVLSKRMLLLR